MRSQKPRKNEWNSTFDVRHKKVYSLPLIASMILIWSNKKMLLIEAIVNELLLISLTQNEHTMMIKHNCTTWNPFKNLSSSDSRPFFSSTAKLHHVVPMSLAFIKPVPFRNNVDNVWEFQSGSFHYVNARWASNCYSSVGKLSPLPPAILIPHFLRASASKFVRALKIFRQW